MKNKPLVSVIVPYYNHGRFLQQACQSALRAYSGPVEVIVVNDGSPEPKARTYLEQLRRLSSAVRVVEQQNKGLSGARNTGLAEAKGEFIQFLDSDDLLVPGKISLQVEQFAVQPELGVSLTNYLLCDDTASNYRRDGDPISRFDLTLSDFLMKWERGFSIPIHCGLFRADAMGDLRFNTEVSAKEDWIFWTTLSFRQVRFSYLPILGAIYRMHPHSMTRSFKSAADSWLAAARILDKMTMGREPGFMPSAVEWHRTFYLPRIDSAEREEARAQALPTAAAPAAAAAPRHGWIEAAAGLRVPVRERPLISVIVPVYNHYRFLPACLSSIVAQNADGGAEIVIADDASSDPRVSPMLEAFAKATPGVQLIRSEENRGISHVQNAAAEVAKGDYLAFLDCDDYLPEGALSQVAAHLRSEPDYLFTDRTDVDENGQTLRVARYGGYETLQPTGDVAADLQDGMVASHLKVIRRETYMRVGGSDPSVAGVQDWELALKIAKAKGRFVYVPTPLYAHRCHRQQVSSADSVRQFWLTNVVRRRYVSPALRPDVSDADALERGRAACIAIANGLHKADPRLLVVQEFSDVRLVRRLKTAWRDNMICVYAPKAGAPVQELNLVREFNSYFDAVLAADEAIACMLVGYMWTDEALVFAGEALHAWQTEAA